jgi:periplasmic divalent cation tolerance protein
MHALTVTLLSAASAEEAETLARTLVERRAAACVQIAPGITSHYVWQGQSCRTAEWLLFAKSTEEKWGAIEAIVREIHRYEVPEVVHVRAAGGLASYADWVRASVAS